MKSLFFLILSTCVNIKASDPTPPKIGEVDEIDLAQQGFSLVTAQFFAAHIYTIYEEFLRKNSLPKPTGKVGVNINLTICDPRLDCGGSIQHIIKVPELRTRMGRYIRQHQQRNTSNKHFFETELLVPELSEELTEKISTTGVHKILETLNDRTPCPGKARSCPGHFVYFNATESSARPGITVREISASIDTTASSSKTCFLTESITSRISGTPGIVDYSANSTMRDRIPERT